MGFFYLGMAISFVIIFVADIVFLAVNLYFWATNGLQALLQGLNFAERIYYSAVIKWLLIPNVLWLVTAAVISLGRKNFGTDQQNYLFYKKIENPKTCVVIPAYNEELAIGKVVKDFLTQEDVKKVIVVDNYSIDKTVEIAEKEGAIVIKKKQNLGFAHSCVMGLKEALKTDANIICLVEGDGTCSGYDMKKMVSYLNNGDMVIGTRQLQVLSEKENQIGMIHVWGNYCLAKLIQIKFFSLIHMGVAVFTDVGCLYRVIRKEALEKIIEKFTDSNGKVIPSYELTLFMTIESLKTGLKIIEIPISFKNRIGTSKIGSEKKWKAIQIGFKFLWYILKS